MKNSNPFHQILKYGQKIFGLSDLVREYDQVRPGKQINDARAIFGIATGLTIGMTSLNEVSQHAELSRSVLEDFLNLKGLPCRLRKFIKSMIKRMKRGKMINLEHVQGKYLASVDGIETFRKSMKPAAFFSAVQQGLIGSQCQVSVHRDSKTAAITHYEIYHRIVIVCMISARGPFPLAWGYQQSTAGETYRAWLSAGGLAKSHPRDGAEGEMAKQDGELTVFKKLLSEITFGNGGKLPFDIIVGDGLYDKAPVLQEVERCGAVLIAVHKDARRILHKDAEEEFTTRIPEKMWSEMKRVFEGWSGVFIDQYISRTDQTIKIIRVVRRHNDGTAVDNYFYCSNKTWITPRLAEWCRHYRWKEENGFNAWTNDWNLLKHVFHHTAAACDAMIGFIFITIIVVVNYQKGNLRRGGRTFSKTLKTFFRNMTTGFGASKKNIGDLLHEYLQPTGID
jgi:hypothetical protein